MNSNKSSAPIEVQKISRRSLVKGLFLGGIGLSLGSALLYRSKDKPMPTLFSYRKKLMGTWVAITIFSDSEQKAIAASDAAFEQVQLVDSLLSIFKRDSQITLLNGFAGEKPLAVDPRVTAVLKRSQHFSNLTGGVYDISVLPLMKLWGFYGHPRGKVPTDTEIALALDPVDWKSIDISGNNIFLKRRGAGIDLGSIGKGYAIDLAVEALKKQGITSALVDAGGNMFAMGAPYGDPDPRAGWRVAIRNPRQEGESLDVIELRDKAVATSGRDQTFVKIGSQEVGHIFNAITGTEAKGYLSATAVSTTGTDSDALSTTAYLVGPEKVQALFSESKFHFFV